MNKLMIPLLAALALAAPTTAWAHDGHGRGHGGHGHALASFRFASVEHGQKLGWHHGAGNGVFEQATGTGSSFGAATASASGSIAGNPIAAGTFAATLATDWTKATTNEHGSCAPATGTVTLTDSAASTNTLTATLSGMVCKPATTTNPMNVADAFFGKATVTSAGGTLATALNSAGKVLLVQKTDGTVKGFAFAGFHGEDQLQLSHFAKLDAAKSGCDGH